MIEPLENLPAGVIGFRAVGTIEASDYREMLDPAIDAALAAHEKVNIVVVMGDDFDHYSLGAMWEDSKLVGRPLSSWGRAAIVTDNEVLGGLANAFGGLVPGDFKVFPLDRQSEAVAWVGEAAAAQAR